ncbi:MAG: hypothetical protein ACWGQW_08700, partial [bacterium]
GKETPRQKMIGMMYLILTAMLALNVSKEAVEAFKKVDMSLTKTTANYIKKNEVTYAEFDAAAQETLRKRDPGKQRLMMSRHVLMSCTTTYRTTK